jgi:glutathione synthase/RimK-type ligase-like ATP-grasp enzyme
MSTGYVERPGEDCDTLIYTSRVLETHMGDLTDLKNCPTLFQQFVQKHSDVRITVVDNDIHAVELQASDLPGEQRCDIRRNNMADVSYRSITLPSDIEGKIMRFMRHYGLRFGAIDMAISAQGDWVFFEVNPNGQWAWLDITAGTSIARSFASSFATNPSANA